MTRLRLVLGDQLSASISSLQGIDKDKDVVLMCEVKDEATYVKHHKIKMVLIFSAMRHFATYLGKQGVNVVYVRMDDPDNTGSFKGEVNKLLQHHAIEEIVVTHPGEYRVLEDIRRWKHDFGIHIDIREDHRFLCSIKDFKTWASNRKNLRMEYFYREMRRQHQVLMDKDAPMGGQWNYDTQNRKSPPKDLDIPQPYRIKQDLVTQEVIALVEDMFPEHMGDASSFHFAVTRDDAIAVLNHFVAQRLAYFGDYQDAMITQEPWMFHSHISMYMNCGLLSPKECIDAAVEAYHLGQAPLNAVEGFVRQILGWREFIRGIYWSYMPEYATVNTLCASRDLPEFYWTGDTNMHCLNQSIMQTIDYGYAHHIQRLMVLGNFTLLSAIDPKQVSEWFLAVYADAFEWVELPNVVGMALYADGGVFASKPYISGGSYIDSMSDYCKHCSYKVKQKIGEGACPFNYLYWDFLERNREHLQSNNRVAMMYRTYDRMDDVKKKAIREDSKRFLQALTKS